MFYTAAEFIRTRGIKQKQERSANDACECLVKDAHGERVDSPEHSEGLIHRPQTEMRAHLLYLVSLLFEQSLLFLDKHCQFVLLSLKDISSLCYNIFIILIRG